MKTINFSIALLVCLAACGTSNGLVSGPAPDDGGGSDSTTPEAAADDSSSADGSMTTSDSSTSDAGIDFSDSGTVSDSSAIGCPPGCYRVDRALTAACICFDASDEEVADAGMVGDTGTVSDGGVDNEDSGNETDGGDECDPKHNDPSPPCERQLHCCMHQCRVFVGMAEHQKCVEECADMHEACIKAFQRPGCSSRVVGQ